MTSPHTNHARAGTRTGSNGWRGAGRNCRPRSPSCTRPGMSKRGTEEGLEHEIRNGERGEKGGRDRGDLTAAPHLDRRAMIVHGLGWRDGCPPPRACPLPADPLPCVQQLQLVEQPSVLAVRGVQLFEEPGVRFVLRAVIFVGRDASGRLSLRLVLPPLIRSRHSIPSSRFSVRREGSEADSISSLGSPVGATDSVAPNRRIHSRKMPPEKPVSAQVLEATQAARRAAATLDTQTPDRRAPKARTAKTAQRPMADHETFGKIRKRNSCFRGA